MYKINILNYELNAEIKIIETIKIPIINSFISEKLQLVERTSKVYYPVQQMLVVVGSDNCYTPILPTTLYQAELKLINPARIQCTIIDEEDLTAGIKKYLTNIYPSISSFSITESIVYILKDIEFTQFLADTFKLTIKKIYSDKFFHDLFTIKMCPCHQTLHTLKDNEDRVKHRQINNEDSVDGSQVNNELESRNEEKLEIKNVDVCEPTNNETCDNEINSKVKITWNNYAQQIKGINFDEMIIQAETVNLTLNNIKVDEKYIFERINKRLNENENIDETYKKLIEIINTANTKHD